MRNTNFLDLPIFCHTDLSGLLGHEFLLQNCGRVVDVMRVFPYLFNVTEGVSQNAVKD